MEDIKNPNTKQDSQGDAAGSQPEVVVTAQTPKDADKDVQGESTQAAKDLTSELMDKNSEGDAKASCEDAEVADKSAAELASLNEKLESAQDQNLRLQAEIQNMHKRFSQELVKARSSGLLDISSVMLETLDNLEKALSFYATDEKEATQQTNEESVKQGVELTYKTLTESLSNFGIKEINPQGEKFNPEYHEALAQVKLEGKEKGDVVVVIQKGYMMDNRLLRAAKVQVAE